MATGSNDIDEIYHRMAVIRRELHTNVRESVAGAEAVVDWGKYTWTYPWIALGAAAAVGYLVYTGSRQRVTTDIASLADGTKAGEPVAGARGRGQERSRTGRNLLLTAWEHPFPRGRQCGPELHAALARTTIPDQDDGADRCSRLRPGSEADGRAGRSGTGLIRSSEFDRNQLLVWRSGRWKTAFKA